MEPSQLQLLLNIVTITGVTSLAGYCYLLKKENRRLATERQIDPGGETQSPEAVQPVVSARPVATVEQDIRTFASARRTRWVKGMASSIS